MLLFLAHKTFLGQDINLVRSVDLPQVVVAAVRALDFLTMYALFENTFPTNSVSGQISLWQSWTTIGEGQSINWPGTSIGQAINALSGPSN